MPAVGLSLQLQLQYFDLGTKPSCTQNSGDFPRRTVCKSLGKLVHYSVPNRDIRRDPSGR